jgi:hypothetical protein
MKPETAQTIPFTEDFRGFLERLRDAKKLVDIRQSVDIRHSRSALAQYLFD